ncbi:MAG: hypothetical protein IJ898_00230 [Prevotella sp.]|nr:hypothetical protein [Prevotella sp.]
MRRFDMAANGRATFRQFVSDSKHGSVLHQSQHGRSSQDWHIPRPHLNSCNGISNRQFTCMFKTYFYHSS